MMARLRLDLADNIVFSLKSKVRSPKSKVSTVRAVPVAAFVKTRTVPRSSRLRAFTSAATAATARLWALDSPSFGLISAHGTGAHPR